MLISLPKENPPETGASTGGYCVRKWNAKTQGADTIHALLDEVNISYHSRIFPTVVRSGSWAV